MSIQTKGKPRNSLEEDTRKRRVDHTQIDNGKSILAFAINYAFIWALSCLFYFAIGYPVRSVDPNYLNNLETYNSIRAKYRLTMWDDASNEELCSAMEEFYFVHFPDVITEKYNTANSTSYSIFHIYNIRIYGLPADPTPSNYSTNYFEYMLNADGSVNPDVLALSKEKDLNTRGKNELHSLLFSSYMGIEINTREFHPEYNYAANYLNSYKGTWKMASFLLAMAINYLILPLFLKHGRGLGEAIAKIGYANKRSGYSVSYWKLPIRMVLLCLFGLIGTYFWNIYYLFIFLIFPYFLDLLYRLFSAERRGIADKFLFIIPVDLTYEKLYRNEAELLQDGETILASYSDDYASTLSSVETISLKDRGDGAH